MKISTEKTDQQQVNLTIEVNDEDMESHIQIACNKMSNKMKVIVAFPMDGQTGKFILDAVEQLGHQVVSIDVKTKQRIGADHQLKNGDVIKIVSSLSRR